MTYVIQTTLEVRDKIDSLMCFIISYGIAHYKKQTYPGKRPQTVCVWVRSVSRKSRDLDALGSREVMVVMK